MLHHSSTLPRERSGFYRYRYATLGYIWSIDSIGAITLTYNFKISIRMAQSLLISKGGNSRIYWTGKTWSWGPSQSSMDLLLRAARH